MTKLKAGDLALVFISTFITVAVFVYALRYFAPQLLGLPADIQLVSTAKEIPPFFSGVFRPEDFKSNSVIIPDPEINRGKPLIPNAHLFGPHDILGFRNRAVPNVADIITIGDSQTYGNNAPLENNWPSFYRLFLQKSIPSASQYSMAVGGWGAVEYLAIIEKALYLRPRMIVVAFYTGNDSLETFRQVYSKDKWENYRTDPALSVNDLPKIHFDKLSEEVWDVTFPKLGSVSFTPKLRLLSNGDNDVVKAGYRAISAIARDIAETCRQNETQLVFTIIPTKELAFSKLVGETVEKIDDDYLALTENELSNISFLLSEFGKLDNVTYIDVIESLQDAVMQSLPIYPNVDGHPLTYGYQVIGKALAYGTKPSWNEPDGLVALFTGKNKYSLGLIRDGNFWLFHN
ncbi:MAG: hypothetical protein AAF387_16070, partial [Pseudomonadota bacterium]